MNNDQMSLLRAALERAAATMRGPTPNDQVADRFGGMLPPSGASFAERFGGMQPPADPAFTDRFRGMQPPDGASFAERFGNMDPAVLAKGDMLQASPAQAVANRGMPPPMMASGTPMPRPRPQMAHPAPQPQPQQAPQEMGFFQRNAAMMQDPVTGMFINPGAASQAQASSGNIINKMLGLLNNKANLS